MTRIEQIKAHLDNYGDLTESDSDWLLERNAELLKALHDLRDIGVTVETVNQANNAIAAMEES